MPEFFTAATAKAAWIRGVCSKYASLKVLLSHFKFQPALLNFLGSLAITCLTTIQAPVQAQENSSSFLQEPLTSVLLDVWRSNPQVLRAESELEAVGFDVRGAKTGYYPYLQLNAAQGTNNDSSSTISVVQPLWSGGLTSAQVREAKAEADVALAELNQIRLDLSLQASEAYLNASQSQEQAKLWERYITGLSESLSVIQRRADKGVSPSVDVETALTRLRQAEAGAAANTALLVSNRAQLSTLLNRQVGRVVWPDADLAATIDNAYGLLPKGYVELHPQRQLALSELRRQEARARVSKAGLWPQLNLTHSQQLQQESGDFTPNSSTQLTLQYQSDSGLRGYRGYQAEKQRTRAAESNLKFAKLDIANRINQAVVERDAAEAQLRYQELSAQSAVKLVDSFLRQFKAGRKSWIEVLNAQQEAHQASLQTSVVRRNYWHAEMRLALEGMLWSKIVPGAPPIFIDASRR